METLISKAFPVVMPIDHWMIIGEQAHTEGRSRSAIIRDLISSHISKRERHANRATTPNPPNDQFEMETP